MGRGQAKKVRLCENGSVEGASVKAAECARRCKEAQKRGVFVSIGAEQVASVAEVLVNERES